MAEPLIRDISDTARWTAVYRARESERQDAVFHDPFARAHRRTGASRSRTRPFGDENAWSFIARTYLFDRFVARLGKQGVDLMP